MTGTTSQPWERPTRHADCGGSEEVGEDEDERAARRSRARALEVAEAAREVVLRAP